MKDFLQNVIADLREKRLLPVAILLLAGLVAVPVLLAKPADENAASPAQPASAGQNEATKALVALADEDSGAGSTLKLFDPRNPFAPDGVKNLQTISSEKLGKASTDLASSESSGGGTGGATDTGGGSGGGSTGGEIPSGGGDTGGGGGTGGGGTEVTQYTYVLDVTFTADGKTHKHKSMSKLTQLPSENKPLLLFLGVDSTGDNAVFLVDSTLKADGEGHCSPSTSDCATLSIGPGSVEHFTDEDGHAYTLRVDEIRKVKIAKASASAGVEARSASSDRSDDPAASADRQVRRFSPPLLADLVTVANRHAPDSSTDKDSR